jgi:hypothetical protein
LSYIRNTFCSIPKHPTHSPCRFVLFGGSLVRCRDFRYQGGEWVELGRVRFVPLHSGGVSVLCSALLCSALLCSALLCSVASCLRALSVRPVLSVPFLRICRSSKLSSTQLRLHVHQRGHFPGSAYQKGEWVRTLGRSLPIATHYSFHALQFMSSAQSQSQSQSLSLSRLRLRLLLQGFETEQFRLVEAEKYIVRNPSKIRILSTMNIASQGLEVGV